jgi:hypothetical protein
MVTNVLNQAPAILNAINPTVITSARVEFVDVPSGNSTERKCMLKIFALTAPPRDTTSSVSITEINPSEDDQMLLDTAMTSKPTASHVPRVRSKKSAAPLDVTNVRRSKRLADLTTGYKTEEAKDKAEKKIQLITQKKRKSKKAKELMQEFKAKIIVSRAPPPPELPIGTIQAIAVNQCHVPPSEVIEEALTSTCG